MKELSPRAQELLRAARGAGQASLADKARVADALVAKLQALPLTAANLPASAPTAGTAPIAASLAAKVVVGVLATAAAVGGVVKLAGTEPHPSEPPERSAQAPLVSAPPAVEAPLLPEVPPPAEEVRLPEAPEPSAETTPVRRVQSRPVERHPEESPPPPETAASEEPPAGVHPAEPLARGSSLGDELRLLQAAQSHLRDHQPDQALSILDEHAASFPDGTLKEERLAARILALCGLGRVEQARAEAERFFQSATRSPHAGRIRASCAGDVFR